MLLAFVFSTTAIAQENKKVIDTFQSVVNNALILKSDSYILLDSKFSAYKKDTLKLQLLRRESKKANYVEGESYALNTLGSYFRDKSQYKKAIALHEEAKKLARTTDNANLTIVSLNMLGVVYRRMDLIRTALDYHTEALKIASKQRPLDQDLKLSIAVSYNSAGNIYLALKQYDLAIEQFEKSLQTEKEYDNKLGLAINYHNIGYAKESKGFLEEALNNYKTSLDYNLSINSKVGEVICYNSIGQVYIKQNKLSVAKLVLAKALDYAISLDDKYYIAYSYINYGWVLYELNNLEDAEKNINIGLKIAEELQLKGSLIEAHKHLSFIKERKMDFAAAMYHYKISEEIDESITNERNLNYVNDLIIQYESEDKANMIKALSNENQEVKQRLEKNKRTLILGAAALFLTGIIFFITYRHRRVTQEKQILLLEQDMLRSQMNPHFIFNSLNSIKLYIINNEKENAVYYLNKFSKLIRKILIANTEKELTLADELETMLLYMNIENIRFSNQIDYKVTIEKDIDINTIMVPSLILQPFLENSIWHGLSTKKENKSISLNISKKTPGYITISITDNGVGREVSSAIKNNKTLNRKSVGIALTKERLANFSKSFSMPYHLEFNDLYDEHKNSKGTQVVIEIPIGQVQLRTA
jgi:tetratricopeptide (TPR) repeat protein/two-component sensor histidine kinase